MSNFEKQVPIVWFLKYVITSFIYLLQHCTDMYWDALSSMIVFSSCVVIQWAMNMFHSTHCKTTSEKAMWACLLQSTYYEINFIIYAIIFGLFCMFDTAHTVKKMFTQRDIKLRKHCALLESLPCMCVGLGCICLELTRSADWQLQLNLPLPPPAPPTSCMYGAYSPDFSLETLAVCLCLYIWLFSKQYIPEQSWAQRR